MRLMQLNPNGIFLELDKVILTFTWKHKGLDYPINFWKKEKQKSTGNIKNKAINL